MLLGFKKSLTILIAIVIHRKSFEHGHWATTRSRFASMACVGSARILGLHEYSMRIWMNPDQMRALQVAPSDISSAIQAQNIQASGGSVGAEPMTGNLPQQLMTGQGRLEKPEEFGAIIVKTNANGAVVRVRDVATVELARRTTTPPRRSMASRLQRSSSRSHPMPIRFRSQKKYAANSRPCQSSFRTISAIPFSSIRHSSSQRRSGRFS